MNNLKYNYFYALYFALLLLGGVLLLMYSKGDFVLYINSIHTGVTDVYFKYGTWLGDGLVIVPVFIVLVFVNYRHAIQAGIIAIFVLIMTQGLKKVVFLGWPRPTAYFEKESVVWNFVDGVEVASYNTFPSGHTMMAFAVFGFLALICNRKSIQVLFLLLALTAALSRVYLLQHFFIDIYFGSLLGIMAVWLGLKSYELGHNRLKKS